MAAPDEDAAAQDEVDWLNRPVLGRRHVGGWKCAACLIGSNVFGCTAFFGIASNLVVYLVQECDLTNAVAANIVTTFFGTSLICSLLGAFLSDAYLGRLWTFLIFQSLSTLGFALISSAVVMISQGGGTSAAVSFLLFSLYFSAITAGPILSNGIALGADQLSSIEEKEKYFRLSVISMSVGQFLAVTAVAYVCNMGWWIGAFFVCTAAEITVLAMVGGAAKWLRQYKAAGNPFLRSFQVLVAACRKSSLSIPQDASLLYEYQEDSPSIPGYRTYQHTATLSFLDKAAVLASPETFHGWQLCTVSQVEELKSIVRIIPVAMATMLVGTASAQMSSLFEEQALNMNLRVTSWLVIPPASLNVFYFGSTIVMGITLAVSGARLPGWVFGQRHAQKVTSLQMQGAGLVCGIAAMAVAAWVESHRLHVAQRGARLSVMLLVPQGILLGMSSNLAYTGGIDFFYSEVPRSMRAMGGSMFFLFQGGGNYISSILVALVTAITTKGGQSGWIANNLNDGHLDYFYWLLACCLACSLGIYILYARAYTYNGGLPTMDSCERS